MNTKPHRNIVAIVCLLFFASFAFAQEKAKRLPTLITESKLIVGQIKLNERDTIELQGKTTFQLTACNSDDSMTGTIIFTLTEESQKKVVTFMNKGKKGDWSSIIQREVVQPDVVAQFVKGTECPALQIDIPSMSLQVSGIFIHLSRFKLTFKENDTEISQRFCNWVRQMGTGFGHAGRIGRRINMLLNGVEPE